MKILIALLTLGIAASGEEPKPLSASTRNSIVQATLAMQREYIAYQQAQISLMETKERAKDAQAKLNDLTAKAAKESGASSGCDLTPDLIWKCSSSTTAATQQQKP